MKDKKDTSPCQIQEIKDPSPCQMEEQNQARPWYPEVDFDTK